MAPLAEATPTVEDAAQQRHEPPAALAPPPVDRRQSIDGIRTIAVVMVMAIHAGFPLSDAGWLGVDIFFVLSGFLITTLLLREFNSTGDVNLSHFWGRRFLRLMPPYILYVGCITIAALLGPPEQLRTHGGWTPAGWIASLWLYFANYAPLGGIWQHQLLTIHLWSLAVEEQFYAIWPILLVILLRHRLAHPAAWALVCAVFVYRLCVPDGQIEAALPTRGIGIVLGCAVALSAAAGPARRTLLTAVDARWRWLWFVASGTAIAFTLVLELKFGWSKAHVQRVFLPLYCVPFAATIASLWFGGEDRISRLLALPPLRYLGQISYGMYLYHMFAHHVVWKWFLVNIEHWNKIPKYSLRFTCFFAITVAIASFSYHVIERPFLRLKGNLR